MFKKSYHEHINNIDQVEKLNDIISLLISRLSNFISRYVGDKFYSEQYETVMAMLRRAFIKSENQSMLLLSRSKTVIHQFISKVKDNLMLELSADYSKWSIKIVRINAILTTKESAILNYFAECLGMDSSDRQALSHDIKDKIEEYFYNHPEVSVLFIFENVEYYIENSKQSLLYKILDMFQYTKIKFAFIATSQKIDIIDNFEKRIKSRFSHKQILFYIEDLKTFSQCIDDIILTAKNDQIFDSKKHEYINCLHKFIIEEDHGCMRVFKKLFDKGKDYEFLCRTLKIALSHLNSTYQEEPSKIISFKKNGSELFRKSLSYVENLSTSNDFKAILSKMPEVYFVVLISGKNALINWSLNYFTFTLAFKEYCWYTNRSNNIQKISRETFAKIFIDLISKGFFKSKSATEFISVNNKVALGIQENDLYNMLMENINNPALEMSAYLKIFAENRAG